MWNKPLLIVVAAPSGCGKSTLCDRLVAELPGLEYSVSCTTRAPRGSEKNGVDYHFLSDAEFERRVAGADFLEHAVVHGHHYGTLRRTVETALLAGQSILMDIDVQGARQLRQTCAGAAMPQVIRQGYIDIFISPPSMDELRRRLVTRGEDAPEVIERRMQNAAGEMACAGEFRYNVVNADLEQAFVEMCDIILSNGGWVK